MKIVAMVDSFKGSASSKELNEAILKGFSNEDEKINIPIADGGEGTMASLFDVYGGDYQKVQVKNALGQTQTVKYLVTTIKQQQVAIIESALIIGIGQTISSDETTKNGSSYGVGQVVADALEKQVEKIYLTLGGTSTTDGGLGFLQALGLQIKSKTKGNPLKTFEKVNLSSLPSIPECALIALTDVTNPYTGKEGFVNVFGPQKGGSKKTLALLEEKAQCFLATVKQEKMLDLNQIPGSGAAGGLGGAVSLIGGQLKPGFEVISQLLHVEDKIKDADLILTGEGKIDQQTIKGKLPYCVGVLAKKHQIPVVAICGSKGENLEDLAEFLPIIFSIQSGPISLKEAMETKRTLKNIENMGKNLANLYHILWQKASQI